MNSPWFTLSHIKIINKEIDKQARTTQFAKGYFDKIKPEKLKCIQELETWRRIRLNLMCLYFAWLIGHAIGEMLKEGLIIADIRTQYPYSSQIIYFKVFLSPFEPPWDLKGPLEVICWAIIRRKVPKMNFLPNKRPRRA